MPKLTQTPKDGIGNAENREPQSSQESFVVDYKRTLGLLRVYGRPTFHYLLIIGIGERTEGNQRL